MGRATRGGGGGEYLGGVRVDDADIHVAVGTLQNDLFHVAPYHPVVRDA